jgi:predicted Zn-dependent protease
VPKRIVTLYFPALLALACIALLTLAPTGAAIAQRGQRLSLIRDAEIENAVRAFVVPVWQAAGLDPESLEIVLVQDGALNAFVAGGQRIFVNTGLLMRTERPNQLIGVLAHETGHVAGGHLARAQEEMSKLSTLQILETILGAGAMAAGAMSGGGVGRSPTGAGSQIAPGSLMDYLQYTQTQEASADQAAITFLDRTHQSPKGASEFLHILQRQERLTIGFKVPYLRSHPLTSDRIATFDEAAARSPYANAPDSPAFIEMHKRMVAKLWGFIAPDTALQRYPESDHSVAARYGRAIALYRTGGLGSALLTIDGLLKEAPNDPYFHELRGQMLFENGRASEAIPSYRRAVQLLAGAGILKVEFAAALLEAEKPENTQEAVRNLELARQTTESDSFEMWRLMSVAYARLNNPGMTSLARAEMSVMRGERAEAQAHAAAAVRQLQQGTPAWQRAQDIQAYINTRPRKR